jgi:translation elongation factor EF-1beta
MGCVGVIQLTRIAMLPKSTDAAVEDIKEDVKETVPNPISASTSS